MGRESGTSDASMGEEDMDEEDKEDGRQEKGEQDVGNGRPGSANTNSKRSGPVKKPTGGRRRASAAAAAVAGGAPGEVGLGKLADAEFGENTVLFCCGQRFAVVFCHDTYLGIYLSLIHI